MLFVGCCCSYCYLRVAGFVVCLGVLFVCLLLGLFCFRFVDGRWSLLVVVVYCMLLVVCCLLFVVFLLILCVVVCISLCDVRCVLVVAG